MEVASNNYMPSDPRLIEQIVYELKSQGIFDQFRKECISDVDTKPAYQNLRQRVEGSVLQFLKHQTWRPDMNKNQVREQLRKNIHESGYLETGVERIVDQVVNPKINTVFLPQVEEVVYKVLGIEKPNKDKSIETKKVSQDDLLPTDLEAVSPESTHMDKKDDSNLDDSVNLDDSKAEEDESPPFEPLEEENSFVVQEDNSVDSHMSGFSGMASHDSNHSIDKSLQMDCTNQDSHISQNSSESRLSIVTSDENTRMEQCDDTSQSKLTNVESVNAIDSAENAKKSEEKSKSRSDDKRSRGSSDKSRSRESKDKDKDKDRKSSSSKDKDHRSRHSSTSRDKDKDKDRVKDKKDYKSSSSSSKDRSDKSKSQNRHSSSNSSSKDKDKSSSKSGSSSSRDKDKSRTSSSSKSNDKIRSSSSDKNRKHSSSNSSSRRDKDKKRDSKKDKDDHYSSKDKKTGRRSTDRDSNDGQSSKHGSSSGSNGTHSSQSQKSNADSTESPNGNGSGESGNSDQNESIKTSIPSESLAPKVKLYKPKFASNIHEARKLMKIRKQIAKLEKQSQLGLVSFEPVTEVTPVVNGTIEEPEVMQVVEEEVLQSKEISKENWEALEARLYQEMSTVNFNSYDSPDDDTEVQVLKSPVKTVVEENVNECRYLEAPGAMEKNKQEWLKDRIEKLENSTVNNLGRKRKFEDFANNNQRKQNFEESNKQLKTQNHTKVNKIKITDFIPSDSFTLPLSPADSDKSNDKKEDLTEISVKQRRNATPKNIRQRYSSEDLYKPRPVFASSRRRGARNKDE